MFSLIKNLLHKKPPLGVASPIETNVPGRNPISLFSYYECFASYYPDCKLNTKKWFVDHAAKDWVYLDCGANIGCYSILFSQLSPNGEVYAFEPTSTHKMLQKTY
jgi:hypothetical protein